MLLKALVAIPRLLVYGIKINPEKTTERMTRPHQHIYHLVQDRSISHTPSDFVRILEHNGDRDPYRDRTLRECLIDEVLYYRRKRAPGRTPHEMVVVRYSHAVGDAHDGVVATDRRLLRLERSKHHLASEAYRSVPLYVFTLPDTPRIEDPDSVLFAEFLRDVISDYELVASFAPPARTMNIVDCAVVTRAISERGSRYSTLPYMSMWYARILFESLRRIAGQPPTLAGPAYKRAGMWDKLSLVDADGRLALDAGDVDLLLSKLARMQSTEVQSVVSTLRDAVRDDLEYDAKADAISDLQDVIETARCRVWEAIAKATAVVHKRVFCEDRLRVLTEQCTQLAAKKAEYCAEGVRLRAQLAERTGR